VKVSHVKCGAFELPFREAEDFGPDSKQLLDLLAEENVLVKSSGAYHWMAESFPAEGVSLRTASIDNFVVIEQGPKARVLGEIDRPSAPLLVHDEAIYMHGGAQYHVDKLDWAEKKAYVRRVEVDYYTDANLAVDLAVLEQFAEERRGTATVAHGEVAVKCVATIFKKLKLFTNENVGWGKINIPEENRHTTAYWIAFDDEGESEDPSRKARLEEGLVGLAHLLRHIAPVFLLCDPKDLHQAAQVRSPFTQRPTVFVYENQPGGVGMARRLFEVHDRLLRAARDLASRCGCRSGCPGCVGPGVGPDAANKRAALLLLERMLEHAPA
jgi:DEAD/DEAH box helicase domain-containing protein